MKSDAISIVEAAYDCESDIRGWLGRLVEMATPNLDRGFGVVAAMYAPDIAPNAMPAESGGMDQKLLGALYKLSLAHLKSARIPL